MTPTFTVIQAEGCGVTGTRPDGTAWHARTLAEVAPGGWYRLIRPPAGVEATRLLTFARGEVGAHYGYATIASIALDKVTPGWFHVPFRRPNTWVCSALGAESLRFGGLYRQWPDIYDVDPADAMHWVLASGGNEVTVDQAKPGDVGFCHSTGLIAEAIRFAQRGEADSDVNHMFILDRKLAS